ncbi:aldo/keto reductase [Dysgonomonas sp. Marseille-P4677]|uniref:aldo/keto reductase n=1 Tax=Dysgonomonas sp. Marseille-P4677 TaxID=2364790 RepID=UPI0019117EE9|nr:aldo/keto reductase [Dysgonomonas sp. Marseille-P4677]MBK5722960.1 aldo/keto reductase [Dysgonomonas sp. Marseille-P4677]
MKYNFCGKSGLQLPEISLGLWHNFGDVDSFETATSMILHAFDNGITHFDLANNYGPPPGSAETNFGKVLVKELKGHRDELIISSKAGHLMWDGPYGDGGSRKYIMASINQSLKRTGLEYFDIFYSHRYDPQTPIEETMQALIDIVRQGKALYIGISKYPPQKAIEAYEILKSQHVPCLIYQDKYSMLVREPEKEHMAINEKYGVGFIAFSPLAQGVLTNRYLHGIPENSRAHKSHGFLQESEITSEVIKKVTALNNLATQRGQTLAEMALAWLLHNKQVTSVIIGTSSLAQLKDNLKAKENSKFSTDELELIERILA